MFRNFLPRFSRLLACALCLALLPTLCAAEGLPTALVQVVPTKAGDGSSYSAILEWEGILAFDDIVPSRMENGMLQYEVNGKWEDSFFTNLTDDVQLVELEDGYWFGGSEIFVSLLMFVLDHDVPHAFVDKDDTLFIEWPVAQQRFADILPGMELIVDDSAKTPTYAILQDGAEFIPPRTYVHKGEPETLLTEKDGVPYINAAAYRQAVFVASGFDH